MAVKKKKLLVMVSLLFWGTLGLFRQTIFAASEEAVERAKNGIVEVQSGFTDAGGKFWRMQYGSGFLVNNEEGDTYIITNSHIVENDTETRNAYCNKHNISVEAGNLSNCVRVIVKGDITVTAEILAKSEEQDFCILSTENVISEKEALRLEDNKSVMAGDCIFSMGFSSPHKNMEYSSDEVQVLQGTIEDSAVNEENEGYIKHTAPITKGNTGGPILNEEGYVVGVNCYSVSEENESSYYALPIGEVQEVLNNFSVYYDSSARDTINEKLSTLYEECSILCCEGGYKTKTLEALAEEMQKVEKLKETGTADIEELTAAYRSLATARVSLIRKTKKSQIIAYVFAVIDALVLIHFLILLSWNIKRGKENVDRAGVKKNFKYKDNSRGRQQTNLQVPVNQNPAYRHRTIDSPIPESVQRMPRGNMFQIYLERRKNGQTVVINKDNFVLGKSEDGTDYCIPENKAVSRKHAMITKKDGNYYITDMGSSNGTWMNGKRICKGDWVRLSAGDNIVLADEEFKVK